MKTIFEYTIIIPVYNEISTIKNVITKILKLKYPVKIIIVDDGSSDGSESLELDRMGKNIIHHKSKKNMGKGNAIRTGLSLMSSEKNSVAIFFDGDDEIPTYVIEQIIENYEKNHNTNAIFGSRFLDFSFKNKINMGIHRYIANKILTGIVNFKFKQKLTDMETALKSFKSYDLKIDKLEEDGFEIEPEVTKLLIQSNINIKEIPVKYSPRSKSEGKKISFSDGFKTLRYLISDDKKNY